MKPKSFVKLSPMLILLVCILSIGLLSWDFQQSGNSNSQKQTVSDTIPTEKKIQNLDDVLDNLDAAKMKLDMKQAEQQIRDAIKNINMEQVKAELDRAMKQVDMEKIKREVDESVAKIDWDKIKMQMDAVKQINTEKLNAQIKEVQENLEKLGPKLKEEMDKAKEKIEKAKAEIKEYKGFVDGLEKDGLINTKEDYTIKHKNGELTINGKKASDDVYNKYRSFLEKHKDFKIEKSGDDFNIRPNNPVINL